MKMIHRIAFPLITLGLVLSIPIAHAAQAFQTGLESEAKVTEAQAQAIALTKVPNGTVRSSELGTEHGQPIWSFDIAQPSVRGVTEVYVDAKSGKILLVKQDTLRQKEAGEAKAEKSSPTNVVSLTWRNRGKGPHTQPQLTSESAGQK
jgi:hypothetical protein